MRFVVCVALALAACKSASAPPIDAAVAPRERPAELAHITLKVLGMT